MWFPEAMVDVCCMEKAYTNTDIVWLARESVETGVLGFVSPDGLYIYRDIAEKAKNQSGIILEQYHAFTSIHTKMYFDSVLEVMSWSDFAHEVEDCSGGSSKGAISVMADLKQWNWTCRGGWWLTPACAALGTNWTRDCIPVIDDSWGYPKPELYKAMAETGMLLAKATIGYDPYFELIYHKSYDVAFCWWGTDSQFAALKPLRVYFREKYERQQFETTFKVAWNPILHVSQQLTHLLKHVRLTNDDVAVLIEEIVRANEDGHQEGLETGPA
jgi:hypothetical protein